MQQTEIKFSMVDVYLSLCAEYKILSFRSFHQNLLMWVNRKAYNMAENIFLNRLILNDC